MVEQQIVDYVKKSIAKGQSSEEIKRNLLKVGWSEDKVKDAMDKLDFFNSYKSNSSKYNKGAVYTKSFEKKKIERPKFNITKILPFMIVILAVIGLAIGSIIWFYSQPVCGNGQVEEGETLLTCCMDVGCPGDQICKNNNCINPACGICQYLKANKCMDYVCCKDSDCDDKVEKTIDECENPSQLNAKCKHTDTGTNSSLNECTLNIDCNDEDNSTKDTCSGTPKKCSNLRIIQCLDGDGYCPPGCTTSDNDC